MWLKQVFILLLHITTLSISASLNASIEYPSSLFLCLILRHEIYQHWFIFFQVHKEFKQNCDEMTIQNLISLFLKNKGTGTEKPGTAVMLFYTYFFLLFENNIFYKVITQIQQLNFCLYSYPFFVACWCHQQLGTLREIILWFLCTVVL